MNSRSRLKTLARRLRQDQTDTEQLMWSLLRANRFEGFKFRRQHLLDGFILDFYCSRPKLNIELDGGQHLDEANLIADRERDQRLAERGITVPRFEDRVFFKNRDGVVNEIWETLMRLSDRKTPLLTSPRVRGEGPDIATAPHAGGTR